jgi:hypothetical protein
MPVKRGASPGRFLGESPALRAFMYRLDGLLTQRYRCVSEV